MITVMQRVSTAKVTIDNQETGAIGIGIMALIAVEKDDTAREADRLLERILNYRIFPDESGRMN